jgi:hypothetical protein
MTVSGFHDDQRGTPARPNSGNPDPKKSVCTVQRNTTVLGSAQNIQLVAQSNDLQLQGRSRYEESSDGAKDRTKQGVHDAKKFIRTPRKPQSVQFDRIIGRDKVPYHP